MVTIASDGVLLAGLDQYACPGNACNAVLAFKSGGNVDEVRSLHGRERE